MQEEQYKQVIDILESQNKRLESKNKKLQLENKKLKEKFSLYGVVGRSEQLCDGLHSTDFMGKCFKCGEQVFVREQK